MSRHAIGPDDQERLVVSPRRAMRMLDCGKTRLYELIEDELDSYLDGRSRKITVESIHRYIERRLQQHRSKGTIPAPRESYGPRKNNDTEVVS